MKYLLLSVLVVCVIGVMVASSAFAQNQIPIQIFSKTHYTLDEVIFLTFKVDRYIPNTPFEVQLCTPTGECRNLQTQFFIAGDALGKYYEGSIRSTDIDAVLKTTGILHFRLDNLRWDHTNEPGEYKIKAYYGPQDDPVGFAQKKIYSSMLFSDEGQKLQKFLALSKWDIGTSFEFNTPIKGSTPEDLAFKTHTAWSTARVLLTSEQPEISVSKDYGSTAYCAGGCQTLDIFITQFENEVKAKRYQQEISKFAPAKSAFYYRTGHAEFNLHDFECERRDRINSEENIQSGGARFNAQSYSCVRDNLLVYVEGSSSAATAAYEPILRKISDSINSSRGFAYKNNEKLLKFEVSHANLIKKMGY